MKRPPRNTRPVYTPPQPEPKLSEAQLNAIADRVLAGDVFQASSVPECAALLAVLRKRGYALKRRTERETAAAPWLFVIEEAPIAPPATIENEKSEPTRQTTPAQADPLRGGERIEISRMM